MSDSQLAKAFLIVKSKKESSRVVDLEALLPELAGRLKKRGVTKQMGYADYIRLYPEGYKHSAFLVCLNTYMGMSKPSMRVPHKAGDKLFIDFTGKRLQHDLCIYKLSIFFPFGNGFVNFNRKKYQ
jgi:transposase